MGASRLAKMEYYWSPELEARVYTPTSSFKKLGKIMISVFVSVQMQVLAVVFFIPPLSVKLKGMKRNPRYC